MKDDLLNLPDLLIEKGLPFAIYSFPHKTQFNLIFQKDSKVRSINLVDIENDSGFVFAEFNSAKTRMADIIQPNFFLTSTDKIDDAVSWINSQKGNFDPLIKTNQYLSKEDYLNRTEYLISKLNENGLKKIVYSRVINKKLEKPLSSAKLLQKLRTNYKSAFINMVHMPEKGIWFGASPEALFKIIDNYCYSDSLAGTKAVENIKDFEPNWSGKEIEEQQLVSSYIESAFSQLGIKEYEKQGPVNAIAGNLCHIKTTYKIPKTNVYGKTGKIIASLHPTPAVCGFPKAEAYELIGRAEQHDRRYYSGFLGPWNLNNQSQLFVNLRCGEYGNESMNIYVGGGLTKDSVAEDEFQETVHKSKTLLSVVENL